MRPPGYVPMVNSRRSHGGLSQRASPVTLNVEEPAKPWTMRRSHLHPHPMQNDRSRERELELQAHPTDRGHTYPFRYVDLPNTSLCKHGASLLPLSRLEGRRCNGLIEGEGPVLAPQPPKAGQGTNTLFFFSAANGAVPPSRRKKEQDQSMRQLEGPRLTLKFP
jgi:hypothetical protein